MTLRKVAFFCLLTMGVGFCISGVFVPPLLAVGVTCIAGAIAVVQVQDDTIELIYLPQNNHVHQLILLKENETQGNKEACNLGVYSHIKQNRVLSYRLPKSFPDPDYCDDIKDYQYAEACPSKTIHTNRP